MHRFVVNYPNANIFKRVFQARKSRENTGKGCEIRMKSMGIIGVNHACIKHNVVDIVL